MMQNYNRGRDECMDILPKTFEPPVPNRTNRAQGTINHATDVNMTASNIGTTSISTDYDSTIHIGNEEFVVKRSSNFIDGNCDNIQNKINTTSDETIGYNNGCSPKSINSSGGGGASGSGIYAAVGSKKSRQSFTIQEKIDFVGEYKNHCRLQQQTHKRKEDQNQSSNNNSDSGNDNDNTNVNQDMTKSMASWLRQKKEKDGINISRSSFSRWYQSFGKNEGVQGNKNKNENHRHKKRRRLRPFHEMESILIEILKVRNNRLRSQNKPISSTVFIRNRAELIYKDLYGDDAATFKCSNGWLSRFLEHYRDVLNPEVSSSDHKKQEQEQQQHYIARQQHQQQHQQQNIGTLGTGIVNANNHDSIILHPQQQVQEHYHHTVDVMHGEIYHHPQHSKDRESEQPFLNESNEILNKNDSFKLA